MPSLFYNHTFEIGNNKKMLALFVDSCFAICANQSFAQGTGGLTLLSESQMLHQLKANQRLKDVKCGNDWDTDQGNKMFTWINDTLDYYKGDSSIAWRATI
jgi:hypothetical protein